MESLDKTSDPQTCDIVLITPAESARRAGAKCRDQCLDDVYRELLNIVEAKSAKGATKLSLTYANEEQLPNVVVPFEYDKYIYIAVSVRINVAALLDHAELIKRFESDGFDVITMSSEAYGTIIDIISWE